MVATQLRLPRRGADYPKRMPFFYHRFTRLLAKVCAAQHVGGDGAWFLTVIASVEDSSKFCHAIAFTDEQLSPIVGASISSLKRIRRRCIEQGWLHYEQGFRGVPSLYWVCVPERYDISNGEYLDDEIRKALSIRGQFDLESVSNSAGNQLESVSNTATSIPLPLPSTSTTTKAGGGGVVDENQNTGDLAAPNAATLPESQHPKLVAGAQSTSEPLRADPAEGRSLSIRLRDLGVAMFEQTLQQALERGHSSESIAAVLAHVESHPGHWGGGAIRRRLTVMSPELSPSDGWPSPDPKAKARLADQRRREAEAKKLEEALSAPVPAATQLALDWAAVESRYRDRIATAALADLKRLLPPFLSRQLRTDEDRSKPTIRVGLLRAFLALDEAKAVTT